MESFTNVILLVICFSAMTSRAMQSGKYVVMTDSTTGAQVCSTDTPSQVSPMCSGEEVQCGMQCLMSSCQHYQIKSSTPMQCELYNQFPWNFMNIANCIGYSLYNSDCSFPFTYNGVLYNGCIPNGATGTCFSVNRTTILPCKTNTLTGVINDAISIGNQPVPVQSISGWIIWMRRVASVAYDWYLPWAPYKNGFGSVGDSNYWLGLERVYQLTSSSKYRLRIEMNNKYTGAWVSVEYWSFNVGDEASTKYQLNVDGYSGETSNSLMYGNGANGMKFSTYDADNDMAAANCATSFQGGWWFNWCTVHCLTCNVNYFYYYNTAGFYYYPNEVRMMMKLQ